MTLEEMTNRVICGDCLKVMEDIPDKSVDMILCDLPYGITANDWDTIILFDKLWEAYKRIIKDNGAIVLTASQPFTSALVMSNPKWFKYEWIWIKNRGGNFATTKYQPMKEHENILVFCEGTPNYYPIKQKRTGGGLERVAYKFNPSTPNKNLGGLKPKDVYEADDDRCPSSWQKFNQAGNGLHPTEKPVDLMMYLIQTYTNPNELVLDNCSGSGSTLVACKKLNRRFIGIEISQAYVDIANQRLAQGVLNF